MSQSTSQNLIVNFAPMKQSMMGALALNANKSQIKPKRAIICTVSSFKTQKA
jgi:hypothetical protein